LGGPFKDRLYFLTAFDAMGHELDLAALHHWQSQFHVLEKLSGFKVMIKKYPGFKGAAKALDPTQKALIEGCHFFVGHQAFSQGFAAQGIPL